MMPTAEPALVLRHVRHLVRHGSLAALSDGQLLERFTANNDEAAFEAIVRRHGPLVLGVCRRILRDDHLAEDAFQAAFLVLAKKARSIRKHDSVGSWLFGVAHRLARHVRVRADRRRGRERPDHDLDRLPGRDAMLADPLAALTRHETQVAVYDEVAALPAPCRGPVILCDLQGLTHVEAARQLDFPLGTLKTRLARGRELLRDRLVRRGVTLGAGGVAALLTAAKATAAVPPALTAATVRAAVAFAGAGGAVPAGAVALADALLRTSTMSTLKLAFLTVLTAGLLTVAGSTGGPAVARADAQLAAAPAAAPQPPRKDSHDDPLPQGALARLGTMRFRHGGGVTDVAFLPDGKSLISAGSDGTARQWDVVTGREIRRFGTPRNEGPAGPQMGIRLVNLGNVGGNGIALSPEGKVLAHITGTNKVTLWDVATGKEIGTASAEGLVSAVAFAPDGKTLAGKAADRSIVLWDTETWKVKGSFGKGEQKAGGVFVAGALGGAGLSYSPDGKTIVDVAAEVENMALAVSVRLWDVVAGKVQTRISLARAGAVSPPLFSPDGKYLLVADASGKVHLYDPKTADQVRELQGPARGALQLAFSPDGKRIYGMAAGEAGGRVWDVATGKEEGQFGAPGPRPAGNVVVNAIRVGGPSGRIAVSRDGKLLAAGGDGSVVRLFDLEAGKELQAVGGHHSAITSVAYADGGKTLLTFGQDRTLRRWDAATGKQTGEVAVPAGTFGQVPSPDGKTLAVVAQDSVSLLDLASGKELRKIALAQNSFPSAVFSPDGTSLAVRVQSESLIRIFNVASGEQRAQFGLPGGDGGRPGVVVLGGPAAANVMSFSADGALLAASAPGSKVLLYHAGRGHQLRELDVGPSAVRSAAFSPDGRSLALDHEDNTVSLWEVATGRERRRYGKPSARPDAGPNAMAGVVAVRAFGFGAPAAGATVAFSPDGGLLAKAGTDQVVYLWDVATGETVERFSGHQGSVGTLAYAPDGKTLASGSSDTTALVWDVSRAVRGRAADLTREQAEKCWADLAGDDAGKAFQAACALTAGPKAAVALLTQHLRPVEPTDAKKLADLITQLDSKQFAARQRAMKELEVLGDLAADAIKKALPGQQSLEARKRLDALLDRLARRHYNSDELRLVRAVETLERMGTTEARRLLRSLAGGAPGALLTEEARAALGRLER